MPTEFEELKVTVSLVGINEAVTQIDRLKTSMKQFGEGGAGGASFQKTNRDLENLAKNLKTVLGVISGGPAAMGGFLQNFTGMGLAVTGFAAAIGLAVKAVVDFSDSFRQLRIAGQAAGVDGATLKQNAENWKQYGYSIDSVAQAFKEVGANMADYSRGFSRNLQELRANVLMPGLIDRLALRLRKDAGDVEAETNDILDALNEFYEDQKRKSDEATAKAEATKLAQRLGAPSLAPLIGTGARATQATQEQKKKFAEEDEAAKKVAKSIDDLTVSLTNLRDVAATGLAPVFAEIFGSTATDIANIIAGAQKIEAWWKRHKPEDTQKEAPLALPGGALRPSQMNPAGRQHGGPVGAGSPYVVGEAGPELFVPHTSGAIIPSSEGRETKQELKELNKNLKELVDLLEVDRLMARLTPGLGGVPGAGGGAGAGGGGGGGAGGGGGGGGSAGGAGATGSTAPTGDGATPSKGETPAAAPNQGIGVLGGGAPNAPSASATPNQGLGVLGGGAPNAPSQGLGVMGGGAPNAPSGTPATPAQLGGIGAAQAVSGTPATPAELGGIGAKQADLGGGGGGATNPATDVALASTMAGSQGEFPGGQPQGLVVHYTGGIEHFTGEQYAAAASGGDKYMTKYHAQLFMDEHGKITRVVPPGQKTWHAGPANEWAEGMEIATKHGGENPNLKGSGINDEQRAALRAYYLAERKAGRYRRGAWGHSEVTPGHRVNEGEYEAKELRELSPDSAPTADKPATPTAEKPAAAATPAITTPPGLTLVRPGEPLPRDAAGNPMPYRLVGPGTPNPDPRDDKKDEARKKLDKESRRHIDAPVGGSAKVDVAFSDLPRSAKTADASHGTLFKNVKMTRSAQLTPAHVHDPKSPEPNAVGSFA